MRATLTRLATVAVLAGSLHAATLVEGFECTTWPCTGWVVASGSGGATNTTAAHDGARGWIGTGGWFRTTGQTIGTPGTRLSMWVRPMGSGRTYFGFGDVGTGCRSLVLSNNTGTLLVQNNASYGFSDITSVPFAYTLGTWYRLEIEFVSATSINGRLYATDGTTQLAMVSATVPSYTPSNIALRSFGTHHNDTIELITAVAPPPVVPAASMTTLVVTFLTIAVAMGLIVNRRMA